MADVTILFEGYNSITQTYNSGGYSQDVAFTGLSSGLGSVTVVLPGDVPVTGVEGTSAVGSVTVDIGTAVGIEVTGVAATTAIPSFTKSAHWSNNLGSTKHLAAS